VADLAEPSVCQPSLGATRQERVPYWLNGAVPLAYLLGDPTLVQPMEAYVEYILSQQADDGWLGPDCCDPWPRFELLLALTQVGFSRIPSVAVDARLLCEPPSQVV
jgi:hypothetical protein